MQDETGRVRVLTDDPEELERETLRKQAEDLARLLDSAIRIPGTPIRIGLDPILGLIPGIGDALATLIGSYILFLGSRLQVPKIVLARMGLNMVLNGVIGLIPGVGDLFSFWFHSNARNAHLLRRYSSTAPQPGTASDWIFVMGVLLIALTAVGGAMVGFLWLVARIWQFVT